MTGIIKDEYHLSNGGIGQIWIIGDDGEEYFGHGHHFVKKSKHYKKGRRVTFDVENNNRAHLDAVNIDVEIPISPEKDTVLSFARLPDGAYVKRIEKPDGLRISMIIKEHTVILAGLSEYEKDIIWIYQRGPSGVRK